MQISNLRVLNAESIGNIKKPEPITHFGKPLAYIVPAEDILHGTIVNWGDINQFSRWLMSRELTYEQVVTIINAARSRMRIK